MVDFFAQLRKVHMPAEIQLARRHRWAKDGAEDNLSQEAWT